MKEKMNNASSNPAEVSYASKIGFGAAKESINVDETNKTFFL